MIILQNEQYRQVIQQKKKNNNINKKLRFPYLYQIKKTRGKNDHSSFVRALIICLYLENTN